MLGRMQLLSPVKVFKAILYNGKTRNIIARCLDEMLLGKNMFTLSKPLFTFPGVTDIENRAESIKQ